MRSNWTTALEERTRCASPTAGPILELAATVQEHSRKTVAEWQQADSTTGLAITDTGVTLTDNTTTLATFTGPGNGYLTDLDPSGTIEVAVIRWGTVDPGLQIDRVTARLHPQRNAGQAKTVAKWVMQMYTQVEDAILGELTLFTALHDPISVDATGTSEADVTFDLRNLGYPVRPMAMLPEPSSTSQRAVTIIVIKALKADGTPADNVGWAIDTNQTSVISNGHKIESAVADPRPFGWLLSAGSGAPLLTLDRGSFTAATITFTINPFTFGATPSDDVEFTVEAEVPFGTSIKAEVRNDADTGWVEFKDGQLHSDVGVSKRTSYKLQVTLTPNANGTATPRLTKLGVREVRRYPLPREADFEGGIQSIDPVTLKARIAEITVSVLRSGERDYLDTITNILSGNDLDSLALRIYWGDPDRPRNEWMLWDAFIIGDWVAAGPRVQIVARSPLAKLRGALPVPSGGIRSPITYTNQTLKAVYDDLIDNQLALPGRFRGPGVSSTAYTVTKKISDSDIKTELDAIAYLAGSAVVSSQGVVRAVDVYGDKSVARFFPREIQRVMGVSPGFSERRPELFLRYQWDEASGAYKAERKYINSTAVTKLGVDYTDYDPWLPDDISKWIDNDTLADAVGDRAVRLLGTGLIQLQIETTLPFPELELGDMVAVETDDLIARDPLNGRRVRGWAWVLGVVVSTDVTARRFTIWVRSYSDIFVSASAITRQNYEDAFTGASFTTTDGTVAAYVYRNTALGLPDGLWRTALYNNDVWRLQKNLASAGDFSSLRDILEVTPSGTVKALIGFRSEGFTEFKDLDATPVADRRLRVIDGLLRATDTADAEGRYISRLSLEPITNAEIAAAAGIAVSKLAAGGANSVLWSDGVTAQWTTSPTIGGLLTPAGGIAYATGVEHYWDKNGTRLSVYYGLWGAATDPSTSNGKWLKVAEFDHPSGVYSGFHLLATLHGRFSGTVSESTPTVVYASVRRQPDGSFNAARVAIWSVAEYPSFDDAAIVHRSGGSTATARTEVWVRCRNNWCNSIPVEIRINHTATLVSLATDHVAEQTSITTGYVAILAQRSVDTYPSFYVEGPATISHRLLLGDGTAAAPALSFSADTNTGIYRPAADVLAFVTAGLERARINASGTVVIGPDPGTSALLRVGGDAVIQGKFGRATGTSDGRISGFWVWEINNSNHVIYSASPSGGVSPAGGTPATGYWNTGHRMRFRTHDSQGFLWENSLEQAVADLAAGTGDFWVKGIFRTGGDGTAAAPAWSFGNDTNTGIFRPAADVLGFATAGSERMRIDAAGGIAVGSTDPQGYKLRVSGTSKIDNDLTVGSLGVFDSTDVPTEGQILIYKAGSINKWQAETLNAVWGDSDFKAQILTEGAAAYVFRDPGTTTHSLGAPDAPSTPKVYQSHATNTLEIENYTKDPTKFRYFEWEIQKSTDGGTTWGAAITVNTTSVKLVHARLDLSSTNVRYRYRVRAINRDAAQGHSAFSAYTAAIQPKADSSTHAFGGIIAGEIAVANLAAISADIGIITAGQLRNTGNTAGVNLGGAGGIPGSWTMGINFESGATVSGMTRYIDFAAGAGSAWLKAEKFELKTDGTAIFRGVAQDADTNPKLKIDFPNRLLTVTDEQASPQKRIEFGKFGAGASYGFRLWDQSGNQIMDTNIAVGGVDLSQLWVGGQPFGGRDTYILLRAGRTEGYASDNDYAALELFTDALQRGGIAVWGDAPTSTPPLSGFKGLELFSRGATLLMRDDTARVHLLDPAASVVSSSTYGGPRVELAGPLPAISFFETDQAANDRAWDMVINAKQWLFRTLNDDGSGAATWLKVLRGSGSAIDTIEFPNGKLHSLPKVVGLQTTEINTGANTAEITLHSTTIPGNAMGANGVVRVTVHFNVEGTNSTKALRFKFGGTVVWAHTWAASEQAIQGYWQVLIYNRNATNSQSYISILNVPGSSTTVESRQAIGATAADTTANQNIVITGQTTNANDEIRIQFVLVELFHRPTATYP